MKKTITSKFSEGDWVELDPSLEEGRYHKLSFEEAAEYNKRRNKDNLPNLVQSKEVREYFSSMMLHYHDLSILSRNTEESIPYKLKANLFERKLNSMNGS